MDERRFDDLARTLAATTDRRGAIKSLVAGLFGIGAFTRLGRSASHTQSPTTINDALPEPVADVAPELNLANARRRFARTSRHPGTRPVVKGAFQVAPAGSPVMSLAPTSGKIKSTVVAKLTGFRSAETVTLLWFDGSRSKPIASGLTSSGGKTSITFTTPYAFRGYHLIRAQGNRGSVADARFAIVPSFTLKPKKGPRGAAVKASLSGFAKDATIDVYFYTTADASGSATKLTSTTVSGTGTGAANFSIPAGSSLGIHRIEGRERVSGRLASAKFIVTCTDASQCPGIDSECAHRTCTNGVCGTANQTEGTQVATQTIGDCQKQVCDGNGSVTSVPDDTDLPNDGNPCTADICQNGVPSFANEATGTVCPGGACDGNGICVAYACDPGTIIACYSGPAGTDGVGICHAGTQTCLEDGSGYGPCQGEVLPGAEICDGLDNDCDGVPDDGAICPPVANGVSACVSGNCAVVQCNAGYANCNGNPADGCETSIMTSIQHCGACGNTCPSPVNGFAVCQSGVCQNLCDSGYTLCGNTCKDLSSDRFNCGECGNSCPINQVCFDGICELI